MIVYPSGGVGMGGCGGYRISGSYETADTFFLVGDIAKVTNYTSVTEITGQPFSNAIDYKRPRKRWNKGDALITNVYIGFAKPVNTIMLINVNFATFNINAGSSQLHYTLFDHASGIYNGIVRYDKKITNIYLSIPTQTPSDGSSAFFIGSIAGGIRNEFSFNPNYPYGKKMVENSHSIFFSEGNSEDEIGSESYHELEYNFDIYSDAYLDQINEAVGNIDKDGYCYIYEKCGDEEYLYLAQLTGNYNYGRESYGKRKATLLFREVI